MPHHEPVKSRKLLKSPQIGIFNNAVIQRQFSQMLKLLNAMQRLLVQRSIVHNYSNYSRTKSRWNDI